MAARKVFRWLAPLALAAVIAAVYLVVHKTLAPKHKPVTVTNHAIVHLPARTSGKGAAPHHARVYIVKSGDSLSSIAVRNHTTVSALEHLNPQVNADALQTGEHLKLSP